MAHRYSKYDRLFCNTPLIHSADQLACVRALFDILQQLNKADHETAEPWQMPSDARSSSAFGHVWKAISTIAGAEVLEHWNTTGEIDPELIRHEVVEYTRPGCDFTTYERKPTNNRTNEWLSYLED